MGRKRTPNLEIEYSLERENKDLKQKIANLKKQLQVLEARAIVEPKALPLKKLANKPCPDCGAELKTTELPHAVMELCSAGCSYRNVRKK
jgi:DNA repair exonuclease SbcCD ATPase subunit